jgi:hypothetical protein
MSETPIEPIVEASKKATVHFAKAAYEVASGVGAIVNGVVRTVRGGEAPDDRPQARHIPVE